jgi:hypothetical protein
VIGKAIFEGIVEFNCVDRVHLVPRLKKIFGNPKSGVRAEFSFRGIETFRRLRQADFPRSDKVGETNSRAAKLTDALSMLLGHVHDQA